MTRFPVRDGKSQNFASDHVAYVFLRVHFSMGKLYGGEVLNGAHKELY